MKLLLLLAFSFLCGHTTFSCMPCAKQVFGVLDSPEYSGATTGVYRPVIHEGKDEHRTLPGDGTSVDLLHGFIPATVSAPPTGPMQVTLEKTQDKRWSMLLSKCMPSDVCAPFLVLPISFCSVLVGSLLSWGLAVLFITVCVLGSDSRSRS